MRIATTRTARARSTPAAGTKPSSTSPASSTRTARAPTGRCTGSPGRRTNRATARRRSSGSRDCARRIRKAAGSPKRRALEVEIRQRAGQPVKPENVPDEELRLMALNSLARADDQRAIPMLEKIVNGTGSPRLKERALYVLAQNGSPEARQIVIRIARGGNPDLQARAVQHLGAFGGPESRQALLDIFKSTDQRDREAQHPPVVHEHGRSRAAARGGANGANARAASRSGAAARRHGCARAADAAVLDGKNDRGAQADHPGDVPAAQPRRR